jgi:ABC-2 type transport system ATP-binding protein
MSAIEIVNLHKSFDERAVLRGLDLQVPEAGVYGLIGPSGVGKTTLLRLLLGFSHADQGQITLLGSRDILRVRQQIGYLLQGQPYPERFTAREFLGALGRFAGMRGAARDARVQEELHTAGLTKLADQPIQTLSPIERQQLGLAQAMLGRPQILLLDEPFAGPDLPGDHRLWDQIYELRHRCPTIVITTQRLDAADYLCDQIGILVQGKLAAEAHTQALRGPGRNVLISLADLPLEVAKRLQALAPAVLCEGNQIALRPNSAELQSQVLAEIVAAKLMIIALEPFGRPIEDLYLRAIRGIQAEPQLPIDELQPSVPMVPTRQGDTLLRELLQREDKAP